MSADSASSAVVTWLHGLDDARLTAHYGELTLEDARSYARDTSRFSTIEMEDHAITAQVQGSQDEPYQVRITLIGAGARIITWAESCTCPVATSCKHAAALLLVLQNQSSDTSVMSRRNTSQWETVLRTALGTPAHEGTRVLALVFEDIHSSYYGRGHWRLSVLRRNTEGDGWQRTLVPWSDLTSTENRLELRNDQRSALAGLSRLAHLDDSNYASEVILERLPSDLWSMLRRAVAHCVQLLNKVAEDTYASVHLDPDIAHLGSDITRSQGDFRLAPQFIYQGDAQPYRSGWTLVGDPAHGVLRSEPHGELRLTQLDAPVDHDMRQLLNTPVVSLPPDDLPRFMALYAPALNSQLPLDSSDDSVDVHQAVVPRCWLRADFRNPGKIAVSTGLAVTLGKHTTRFSPEESRHTATDEVTRRRLMSLHQVIGGTEQAELTGRAMLDFVSRDLPRLNDDPSIVVTTQGTVPEYHELTDEVKLHLDITDDAPDEDDDAQPEARSAADASELTRVNDWFGLDIHVAVGDVTVPIRELLTALVAGDDYLMLDSGQWLSLDRGELDPLRALVDEASTLIDPVTGQVRINRWQIGIWEQLATSGVITTESRRWKRNVDALLNLGTRTPPPVPSEVNATLRGYQVEGYQWLTALWSACLGGILADDMGLGKTLQTLCLLQEAHDAGELNHPALVVAPTSVMAAWTSEAKKFCPGLKVMTMDQTAAKAGVKLAEAIEGVDLVVTSYTLVRLDATEYTRIEWSGLFLDEAQFVKNHQAKTYGVIRQLRARMRLAITGTPLENSLMDLWSLLSIAAPGVFPDPKSFTGEYAKPIESGDAPERLTDLKRRINPLVLRRTKHQVAAELPPKQEFILPVTLEPKHRRIYDRQLQSTRMTMLGLLQDASHNRIEILAALTKLRQLSLDPSLVDPQHSDVGSAKIDTLVEHLHSLQAEGHRALVFSQFTSFLHIVRDRLTEEGIAWEYLDGQTRHRADHVQAFKEGDATAFLISLKAGGFGLTLTEADYVFVLDPWWNPAAENQAIDRTHRIGQDKQVMVYRLVSADTVEEKVMELQQRKRDLFDQVVGDEALSSGAISIDDIRGLFA